MSTRQSKNFLSLLVVPLMTGLFLIGGILSKNRQSQDGASAGMASCRRSPEVYFFTSPDFMFLKMGGSRKCIDNRTVSGPVLYLQIRETV